MRLSIPDRQADAPTGGTLLRSGPLQQGPQRDSMAALSILSGNVPEFLRELQPVVLRGKLRDGAPHELLVHVTPDYLCVGGEAPEEDGEPGFVRVPLGGPAAQEVADAAACLLPTKKVVDAVWAQAQQKLSPRPWGPPYDHSMLSTARAIAHSHLVDDARRGLPYGQLSAGQKKDVIVHDSLAKRPGGRVCIYGWHELSGKPIQPVNASSHEATYADYSHGIRLVARSCSVDGQEADLEAVMRDPLLAALLCEYAPAKVTAYGA